MADIRSTLRTYLLPGLAKLLAVVGVFFVYIGFIGPIARVFEYGWYEGLFTSMSVIFFLLFAAGIIIVRWVYPFLPPSLKTGTRS
ncbi:MAG TPA: hypothetical protein VMW27_24840 [Thermoanaerobaculia bacterium]|nr:hypothetical protein [Thermoanaerobaculia bacterium]